MRILYIVYAPFSQPIGRQIDNKYFHQRVTHAPDFSRTSDSGSLSEICVAAISVFGSVVSGSQHRGYIYTPVCRFDPFHSGFVMVTASWSWLLLALIDTTGTARALDSKQVRQG
jgi:hypothetical protein